MDVKIYIPHPALQQYVVNISTVNVVLPEGLSDVVTPYPPTPFQSLIFYCRNRVQMAKNESLNFDRQPFTVVIGPQYSRVNIQVHKQLSAIRVDFYPGALYRILKIPMHEMFDTGFDASDLLGPEMKELTEQLLHISDLEQGKDLVEKFLLNQTPHFRERMPFDSAMLTLLNSHGTIPIEHAASISCLSLRQFERKCKERLGMNPKMYARILKFSKAYRLHESFPKDSWIEIAYQAGYYDQMHMIRDFKEFAGVNPSIIQRELSNTPLRMQKDLLY